MAASTAMSAIPIAATAATVVTTHCAKGITVSVLPVMAATVVTAAMAAVMDVTAVVTSDP
jgi:hypothetical protein